jgi:hypothetical protein
MSKYNIMKNKVLKCFYLDLTLQNPTQKIQMQSSIDVRQQR